MPAVMRTRTPFRAALIAILVLWSVTGESRSQGTTAPDPFARIDFLIGRWEGTSEGKPGKGTVRRDYTRY